MENKVYKSKNEIVCSAWKVKYEVHRNVCVLFDLFFFSFFVLHIYSLLRALLRQNTGQLERSTLKAILYVSCNKPSEKWARKLSVSRQIIKPQGQRAGFILDTISVCQWPFICAQMKTDRDLQLTATFQVMQFTWWVKQTLLSPLLPHYCLIFPYHSVSVLCLKHHPFPRLLISFSSLSRFSQRARFALAVAGRLWCGLTMWLVPLLNLIILAS